MTVIACAPHIRRASAHITPCVVMFLQTPLLVAALGWLLILGTPAEGNGKVAADSIPPELVGRWVFAAGGDYCTDLDGCTIGSGGSISFRFAQDGRVNFALFEASFVEGCGAIRSLVVKQGRIAVEAGTMVFTPSTGRFDSVNACRPDLTGSWTFDPDDLEPVSLHWRLEGEVLHVTDSSGEASGVYSRR